MSLNRQAAVEYISGVSSEVREAIATQMEAISLLAGAFDTRPQAVARILVAAGQEALNAADDATKISKVVIEGLRAERGDEWAGEALASLSFREEMAGGYAPEVDFTQFPEVVKYLNVADPSLLSA